MNRGQAAVSSISEWARLMWPSLACPFRIGYLLYLRLSRRMIGRRLHAWDPSCASQSWAALDAGSKSRPSIPKCGTHVGLARGRARGGRGYGGGGVGQSRGIVRSMLVHGQLRLRS